MTNDSGILPSGHRVVICPEEVEQVSKGGILVFTDAAAEKEALAQIYGRIVAVGPEAWQPAGLFDWIRRILGLQPPWARVGDRVIFGKYSGLIFPGRDGVKYRVVNDRDVVAVVF